MKGRNSFNIPQYRRACLCAYSGKLDRVVWRRSSPTTNTNIGTIGQHSFWNGELVEMKSKVDGSVSEITQLIFFSPVGKVSSGILKHHTLAASP
jgi:hypothetical protein